MAGLVPAIHDLPVVLKTPMRLVAAFARTERVGCLLLPRRLAQRRIDAVLPAGALILKKIKHVAVEPQGHGFFGARQRSQRGPARIFNRLRRHRLEGSFGRGTGIGLAPCLRWVPPISRPVSRIVTSHVRYWRGPPFDAKRRRSLCTGTMLPGSRFLLHCFTRANFTKH